MKRDVSSNFFKFESKSPNGELSPAATLSRLLPFLFNGEKKKVLEAQSCLILCDCMDWSPPGPSVHGIFQATILEWVAIPLPGDLPHRCTKPRSPTLKANSLLSDPPRKPGTKWEEGQNDSNIFLAYRPQRLEALVLNPNLSAGCKHLLVLLKCFFNYSFSLLRSRGDPLWQLEDRKLT